MSSETQGQGQTGEGGIVTAALRVSAPKSRIASIISVRFAGVPSTYVCVMPPFMPGPPDGNAAVFTRPM